ncbi:MAG: hypothetical protein WBN17_05885 [Aureibaculum sp.]
MDTNKHEHRHEHGHCCGSKHGNGHGQGHCHNSNHDEGHGHCHDSENGKGHGHCHDAETGGGKVKNKGGSFGSGGFCICAKCGEKISHQKGVKCTTLSCPSCGKTMVREELLISKH